MAYYIKGGSRYNEANPTVWTALILGGYNETTYYEDVNWKQIDYSSIVQSQDPFWLMGSATGGAKEFELGLYNDYRIRFKTTGIEYYDGSWKDLLAEGGASNLSELGDVVISGTPAEDELLAWDTGSSKWINQTPGEAGLATAGHGHGQLHDESHTLASHSSEAHNELTGYNDETDVKHLTDAQVTALHAAAHTHNGDTLQLDGINSDGGVFSFTTTGAVTFNQDIAIGTNKWATAGTGRYFRFNSSDTSHISIFMDSHSAISGIFIRQHASQLASAFRITTSEGANIFEVDVNNDVNINGDIVLDSGKVITSADEDLTFLFGRARLGSGYADFAGFSHRDMSGNNQYALLQSSGGVTTLNAENGQFINFAINNTPSMVMNATTLTMSVPIAMGANKITGLTAGASSGEAVEYDQISGIGNALTIKGITVDDTDIDNGKILKYNSTSGNLEYEIDDTGAGFAPPIGFIAMFSGSWTDNSTIPGWYKCDGNNGTVNLVNKFVRGAATSGGSGGDDDAVVVSHSHNFKINGPDPSEFGTLNVSDAVRLHEHFSTTGAGVSGVGKNIPAYYALIFIQRIS